MLDETCLSSISSSSSDFGAKCNSPAKLPMHFGKTVCNAVQSYLYRRMSSRTYADAIHCLNTLQSNKATLDAVKASGGRLSQYAIPEMIEYLQRIGYTTDDLNKLNVIHVTGTKGKGSTCAFINSILMSAKPNWKIGLYTSPHMVAVRERIRVNGIPISEENFAKYFFDVWDKLETNDERKEVTTPAKPMYFRFVTLVALHAYLSIGVDATVLEVGVGGTYDSTNIVPKPLVTAITSLGIDHVGVLGSTLAEIAWHKAGIFKAGVPALTLEQPADAMAVIRNQADELQASSLSVVPVNPELKDIKLGLAGTHQQGNASLAVQAVRTLFKLENKDASTIPAEYLDGLKNVRWPGRCQTISDPGNSNITWHLDGAHTTESLACCIEWYVSPGVGLPWTAGVPRSRILIFNCTHGRAGSAFLTAMLEDVKQRLSLFPPAERIEEYFDHVIFCTNVTYSSGTWKSDLTAVSSLDEEITTLRLQHELATVWASLIPSFPKDNIYVLPSIESAVKVVKAIQIKTDCQTSVLVTGSLHLVGGLIEAAALSDVAL